MFISPGWVLTAAHVVHGTDAPAITVSWSGGRASGQVFWAQPGRPAAGPVTVTMLPDLALVQVSDATATGHECVYLADVCPPRGTFTAYGYSQGVTTADPTADAVTVEFEHLRHEPGGGLIKCKDGAPQPGLSGGPLFDPTTGQVVGVVKAQRDPELPVGLYAVSIETVRAQRRSEASANRAYHMTDRRWRIAASPATTARDLHQATLDVLGLTLLDASTGAGLLPGLPVQGGDRYDHPDVHQRIRVGRRSPVARVETLEESDQFTWNPAAPISQTTVVRGLPGYGKTWLLNFHARSTAEQALAMLGAGSPPVVLRLPVVLTCNSIAEQLPDQPAAEEALDAVRRALRLQRLPDPDRARDASALISEAFTAGRLVLCLDGLDEVPGQLLRSLRAALPLFAAAGNEIMLTTRPSALPQIASLPLPQRADVELAGFGVRQTLAYTAAALEHRPVSADLLRATIQSESTMRELAAIPLLLSFLCRLVDRPGVTDSLPRTRTELLSAVVQLQLSGRTRDTVGPHEDLDAPTADAGRRLRMLARSLGDLQDSWRGFSASVSRHDLAANLHRDPDHAYLRAEALDRWHRIQHNRHQPAHDPPADPVMWELIEDGILVDESLDGASAVRFLHPTLQEFVLATYVVGLSETARIECVERHRWFDPEWQSILGIAIALVADPGALINHLRTGPDPWFAQAQLSAVLVAQAPGNVAPTLVEELVDTLAGPTGDDDADRHPADRRRCLTAFGVLVRAAVPEAVARAHALLPSPDERTGKPTTSPLVVEAICSLVESGDARGADAAAWLVAPGVCPLRSRARLLRALARHGSQESIEAVMAAFQATTTMNELEQVLTALAPEPGPLLDFTRSLLDQRSLQVAPRQRVAAALIECGGPYPAQVSAMLHDPSVPLDLRTGLLRVVVDEMGVDDSVHAAARELFSNPNCALTNRAEVASTMLRAGVVESWLLEAQHLLRQPLLPRRDREALAAAIAGVGEPGLETLRTLARAAEPFGHWVLVLDCLWALVDRRDPQGLRHAGELCRRASVPSSVRAGVQRALLLVDDRVDPAVIEPLLIDPKLPLSGRVQLITRLCAMGSELGRAALITMLAEGFVGLSWPVVARELGTSDAGRNLLRAVCADHGQEAATRTEAAVALAAGRTNEPLRLPPGSLEALPDIWRTRVLLSASAAGHPAFLDDVVALLPHKNAAYEALHGFAMVGQYERADVDTVLERAAAAIAPARDGFEARDFGPDQLRAWGLTWDSRTEERRLMAWAADQLQEAVGIQIMGMMLPAEVAEFTRLSASDDEASSWLTELFPEMRDFVDAEFANLEQAITSGALTPPQVEPGDVFGLIAQIGGLFAEWKQIIDDSDWNTAVRFVREHEGLLTTDLAVDVLLLALGKHDTFPVPLAQTFTVLEARRDAAWLARCTDEVAVDQRIRQLFQRGEFFDTFLAGALGIVLSPRSAPMYFYAALGAWGTGNRSFAEQLMVQSGRRAEISQVQAGSTTIQETADAHDWGTEAAELLVAALHGGFASRAVPPRPDDEQEPDQT